jgi:hypothetical protein
MNNRVIKACSLFLIWILLLFVSCNGNRSFHFGESSKDIQKNEQELWVRKESYEIRRMGFQKERSFMMGCKDPELEEFKANYFRNAEREGVNKEFAREELEMMY